MAEVVQISFTNLLGVFLVGMLAAKLISLVVITESAENNATEKKFESIEGLRGILAMLVYIAHLSGLFVKTYGGSSSANYQFLYPISSHMGRNSVDAFFMITAFLFTAKLIDSRQSTFNWLRLWVSRFLRLVPLYMFALILIFLIIGFESDWTIRTSWQECLIDGAKWLAFTIPGHPSINGFDAQVLGSVTWSLTDEWKFYFSLPIIGFFLKVKSPPILLIASLLVLVLWHPHGFILCGFLGGMVSAWISRTRLMGCYATSPLASVLVLFLIYAALNFSPSNEKDEAISTIFIAIAFWIIAAGNSMFGILVTPAFKVLGSMAYSIYLLHLVVIYFLLEILNIETSQSGFWVASMFLITPLLVCFCYLTYRFIEKPFMNKTNYLTNALALKWQSLINGRIQG
jgi:peptidoglycan/LPS O-acetylase OafA/YrhL